MGNVFDDAKNRKVPVTVVINGKQVVIGEAELTPSADGLVHVDMDLKTDDENDVIELLKDGITGYSSEIPRLDNYGFGKPANPLRRS